MTIASIIEPIQESRLFDHYVDWLKQRLTSERLEHSLGAVNKAQELAQGFRLPEDCAQKGKLAALLHDAAKQMSPQDLSLYCQQAQIKLSDEDQLSPQTIHPFVGAHMVEQALQISDADILNAIRYHTTGRSRMSLVEKLVYVADKIEENTRNPLYTKRIMSLVDYHKLIQADAMAWIEHQGISQSPETQGYDIIFLDPPFVMVDLSSWIDLCFEKRLIKPETGILIWEHPKKIPEPTFRSAKMVDRRQYGASAVSFFKPLLQSVV